MRSTTRTTTFMLLLLAGLINFGCGSSQRVSFSAWQSRLREYSQAHSRGDLSFLRDPQGGSPHRTFSIISTDSPESATDATGVLVTVRELRDQPKYIFLVGLMKSRVVQDIRIALLTIENQRYQWKWSRADQQTLQTYRNHKAQEWRDLHPGRQEPPAGALQFPADDDVFDAQVAGDAVTITEKNSRAQWVLTLAEQDAK